MKSWCCNRRTPSGGFRLYANQDEGVHAGQGIVAEDPNKVRVDGEEATIHITDQSIMFEKEGRVSGLERSAIRMLKPDGDAMIIAYAVGSEVKSVKVEPLTAVASLVTAKIASVPAQVSAVGLNTVFEMLYWESRKELEERLAKVEMDPLNAAYRLSLEDMQRYIAVRNQMTSLASAKHGVDLEADPPLLTFWGLEKEPHELQADVVKIEHLNFLMYLVSQKAETEDIGYATEEVWPDDWPRVLERFALGNDMYLTEDFTRYVAYLKSKWKHRPRVNRPAIVSG